VIRLRKLRWAGHGAQHDRDEITKFWSKNLKGREHSEDLDVDGRTRLKWMLVKYGGKVWNGCI
jgi:hypothetical protein